MKKKFMLLGALILAFSLVSCGGKKEEAKKEEPKKEEVKKEEVKVDEPKEEEKTATETVKEEVEEAKETATEAVKEEVEEAKEAATEAKESLTEEVKEAVEEAKETAEEVKEAVTEEVKEAVEEAKETAEEVKETVSEEAKEAVEAVKEEATSGKTVAEYKEEIQKITSQFTDITNAASTINPTNAAAAVTTYTEMSGKIKPLLTQLAAVEAPESLKDSQAKLAAGAQAYADFFDLQSKVMSNPASALESASKITELQSKLNLFTEGLAEINAAK